MQKEIHIFHGNHGNNYLNNSKFLEMVQYKTSNENVSIVYN